MIRAAHEEGKKLLVYVDETRPVLQGARLTAWELMKEGIPDFLINIFLIYAWFDWYGGIFDNERQK